MELELSGFPAEERDALYLCGGFWAAKKTARSNPMKGG
jgi:hypothetical protein